MHMRKWEINHIDKVLAKKLALECDVDPFIAMIAASRGYDDPALLEEFLSDELIFSDPFELADMYLAADCINDSIAKDELIAVYGDYDCDGVTATALLYSYLSFRGARVIFRIPDRFSEGYGMNIPAIDELNSMGVNLIVTVDNGISCVKEIEYAKNLGMKVVVTDHHLPPENLPDADAVVDPHRADDASEFKDICGVGVAFKLVCALHQAQPEEMISSFGDLVALGTIGDVMPLVNENRAFVKSGFALLKHSRRAGIKALIEVSGLDNEEISVSRISFGIVPRINAAGRMGSAQRAVKLLLCDDENEAINMAEEINLENTNRQEIEKEICTEAERLIESQRLFYDRVIVVAGENWHHGIVGIVASRICEHYGKPTIVLSIDGDLAHGSGRSIEGFSLYDAVCSGAEFLEKFGGHSLAAGLTLKKENISAFRNAINDYAVKKEPVCPILKLDCKLNPAALSLDLVYALDSLAPFGNSNSVPIFAICGAQIEGITSVGNGKHLKISFIKGPVAFQAMLFSVSESAFPFKKGELLDIAVQLDKNFYGGKEYLSIKIKDFRYAGINDSTLAVESADYDEFSLESNKDFSSYAPTREECGAVYRYILKGECITEGVVQRFMNTIGYMKVRVIIDILCELELVRRRSIEGTEVLSVINVGSKVELENSTVLKRLRG